MSEHLDLAAPEVHQDLDGFARAALADGSVQWSEAHRAWLVVSHAEVVAGFRDLRLSSDRSSVFRRQAERVPGLARTAELLSGWMVFRDPPAHPRLRAPVWRAFTARSLGALHDSIVVAVEELLDGIAESGRVDLGPSFARPLPALVIADLLGVGSEARQRFESWSDQLSSAVFSVSQRTVRAQEVAAATDEFELFFTDELERRRAQPTDDLLSLLAHAEGVEDLSPLELVGACTLLLFAGHETTTGLLMNAVHLLADHPDQVETLARGGASETAADELLRLVGPAKIMVRIATEDHERGGHVIAAGDTVFLVILTANRDPEAFERPGVLDLSRSPNPHVGFGWGPHHCLGANLARLETTIALEHLYARFPELRIDGTTPPWTGTALGLATPSLRVAVD